MSAVFVDWLMKKMRITKDASTPSGSETNVHVDLVDQALERLAEQSDRFSDAYFQMGVTTQQMDTLMASLGKETDYSHYSIGDLAPRNEITEITIERSAVPIDSWSATYPTSMSMSVEIKDQDGRPVPADLAGRVREVLSEDMNVNPDRVMEELETWKKEVRDEEEKKSRQTRGHKLKCPYNPSRPTDYGCSCYPPYLHIHPVRWHCWACEQPRAHDKDQLCDGCAKEDYANDHARRSG